MLAKGQSVKTHPVGHHHAIGLALAAVLVSVAGALAQAPDWRITPSDLRGSAKRHKYASGAAQLDCRVAGLHEGTPGYDLLVPAYSYTLNCGRSWSLPYQQRFGNEKTLHTITAHLDTLSAYQVLETMNVRSREKPVYRCRAPLVPFPTADWALIGNSTIARMTERGTTIEDAQSGAVFERGLHHVSGGEFSDGSVAWLEMPLDISSSERPMVVHWRRGREPKQVCNMEIGERPCGPATAFESHGKKWLLVPVRPETRGWDEYGCPQVWIANVVTGEAEIHDISEAASGWTACPGGVLCVGFGVSKFAYDGVTPTLEWHLDLGEIWQLIAWSPDHRLAVLQVVPAISAETMLPTGDRVVVIDGRNGRVLADLDPEGDCSDAGALVDAKRRLHLIPKTDLVDLVYEIDRPSD